MCNTDINKYRLTSLEEPTDEMLHQIMKEVAEEVKAQNEECDRRFLEQLREAVRQTSVSSEIPAK